MLPVKSEDLQKQIEEIDLQLYNLLLQRTELVEQLPCDVMDNTLGKEAAVIKNLLKIHRGNFPKYVIAKIWREILTTSACLNEKLKFSVFGADGCDGLTGIVQEHFGSYVEFITSSSFGQVMNVVSGAEADAAIIPCDNHEMNDKPWWSSFSSSNDGFKIVSKLPFLKHKEAMKDDNDVYVVALTRPDKSGDDISLLGIEVKSGVSASSIAEALEAAGFENSHILLMAKVDEESKSYLVEVDGFVKPDDKRLPPVKEQFDNVNIVGSYARPIEL